MNDNTITRKTLPYWPNLVDIEKHPNIELSNHAKSLRKQIEKDYPNKPLPKVYVIRAGTLLEKSIDAIAKINSTTNDFMADLVPSMRTELDKQAALAQDILKTPLLNAAAMRSRFSDRPVIVLSEALLSEFSTQEVGAIIAHEYGHVVCNHLDGKINLTNVKALESEADRFAVRYGYEQELISALKKLEGKREQFLPYSIIASIANTHPETSKRVSDIQNASHSDITPPDKINMPHSSVRNGCMR